MNTDRFPNLTPSRAVALTCRKRFHAEHVARSLPPTPFSTPLAYGSAVHETLKGVFNPNVSAPPAARDVRSLARNAFSRQGYPIGAQRDADLEKCIACVTAYLAASPATEETVGVEIFDSLRITHKTAHPLALGAKFDRLLSRTEAAHHLCVRDYKTGAPGPLDLDGAVIMLAIIAVKFKEYDGYSVEYDYLDDSGLRERRTVTFADAKAAWPDLKARAVQMYDAQAFPAEPGEHCQFCPLRAACQPDLIVDMDDLDALLG